MAKNAPASDDDNIENAAAVHEKSTPLKVRIYILTFRERKRFVRFLNLFLTPLQNHQ